jgi:hypothetical protein
MNNLDKQRPGGWRDSSLFCFVEDSWSNALATYHAMPEQAGLLELVDSMFARFSQNGLTFAALLFIRAHAAYRVAAGLALATPIESYSVIRSSLEYAGYALYATKSRRWQRSGSAGMKAPKAWQGLGGSSLRPRCARLSSRSITRIAERYQHLYRIAGDELHLVRTGSHADLFDE